jgi:uncharacterized protein YjbI with pentapeptide repeats
VAFGTLLALYHNPCVCSHFDSAPLYTFANLKGSDSQDNKFVLDNVNLCGVNLADADLEYISLKGSNVSNAHLVNTDLSNANLSNADLGHSYLANVDLSGANLKGANLSDLDLRNDTVLTQEQIDEVRGNERTLLPDDLQRRASWG